MPSFCKPLPVFFLVFGLVFGQPDASFAAGMNGPPQPLTIRSDAAATNAATGTSQPLLGAIRFFQKYISSTDGARCPFSPTCSAFGHQAIHRHGPWIGVLMTADRLMRCGYGTNPDLYPHLPNGRLVDPVTAIAEEK